MRSVRSLGGPLILLPQSALHGWFGPYGQSGDDDVDEGETAYWEVSQSVTDYADSVEAAGVSALVLANGKARTTFLPDRMLFVQEVAGRLLPRDWERLMDVVPGIPTVERQGGRSAGRAGHPVVAQPAA